LIISCLKQVQQFINKEASKYSSVKIQLEEKREIIDPSNIMIEEDIDPT